MSASKQHSISHFSNHPIFEVLKSDTKTKLSKNYSCKNTIAIFENDFYIWNANSASILTTNLKLFSLSKENQLKKINSNEEPVVPVVDYQNLLCTNAPVFKVDSISLNATGSHVLLWGAHGVSVLQLPQRWGRHAHFEGGKQRILCKNSIIGERFVRVNSSVELLHVEWYPASLSSQHILTLTSDNTLRLFDILDPTVASQVIHLNPDTDQGITSSYMTSHGNHGGMTFLNAASTVLGERAVSFGFGEPARLRPAKESRSKVNGQAVDDSGGQCVPVYILWGNGDIYCLISSLNLLEDGRPPQTCLGEPLKMYPPAEDNYGVDACSLLVLHSKPPVLVIATCSGRLHHGVLLANQSSALVLDDESSSEFLTSAHPGWQSSTWRAPDELSVYMFETVELELTLLSSRPNYEQSTEKDDESDVKTEDIVAPVKLHKDSACYDRYHSSHVAGVHAVAMPWLTKLNAYCHDDSILNSEFLFEQAVVEHLICTRPNTNSPPSPILGLCITPFQIFGSAALLSLTSDLDLITLSLHNTCTGPAASSLLSSAPDGASVCLESPLKRTAHQKHFLQHITDTLHKEYTNPLIRANSQTEASQQECFHLLSRSTQIFRDNYLAKQELAKEEIERRVRILKIQKEQQQEDLKHLLDKKSNVTENAQNLASKYEDVAEYFEKLVQRIEVVLRKFQSRLPTISDAEKKMHKELCSIDDKVNQYKSLLQQLKIKEEYQTKQFSSPKSVGQERSTKSPRFNSTQYKQIKSIIQQEGDEIGDLMKKIKEIKLTLET